MTGVLLDTHAYVWALLRRDLRLLSRDAAFAAVHGLRVVW